MRAVVLAGGRGTRLAPYTVSRPKPLMPIGDLPVIEILIRRLRAHGIREITLAVGHLAELIRAFCLDGSQWDVSIEYSYEKEPLGTAGPLALIDNWSEPILVLNGDLLTDLDFRSFIAQHLNSDKAATIGVHEHKVKLELGIIETCSTGEVSEYIEKPEYTYRVSMGVYVLSHKVREMIPSERRFDLPDLVQHLISRGAKVGTFLHRGYWMDIGRPDDYRRVQEDFPGLRDKLLPGCDGSFEVKTK